MKILVTGGAGFIGSITVKALQKAGHDVVVFDNLEYGHKEAVSVPLVVGDLLDKESFAGLDAYKFDAVIHFAAYLQVAESMKDPAKYFNNNVQGGVNLLEYMREKKIPYIVFSSTAAIFGTPLHTPIEEDAPKNPTSVYGESKLMFEKVLSWYDKLFGIKSVALRYFNAAGAALDGSLGEDHSPETHIIPVAMQKAMKNEEFLLFGSDYDTPDGTCIRDYIHVEDLAKAHILAIEYLSKGEKSNTFNLGVGRGYSNKEVVEMVKKVIGIDFKVKMEERRPGDPSILLADNKKSKEVLKFEPEYSDLETIVKTAWEWQKKLAEKK
ncbi:MAG TPA: UDP-glucose 4-epimerase GalE [Patescibacteria group bacterium]